MTDHEKDFLFNAKKRVELAITTHDGDEKALLIATIAQAEATIAVAEELRTANLISIVNRAADLLEDDDESKAAVEWLAGWARKVRGRVGMEQ